ncbi:hypothetical protein LguiA_024171 [Lonicera macranthoides]
MGIQVQDRKIETIFTSKFLPHHSSLDPLLIEKGSLCYGYCHKMKARRLDLVKMSAWFPSAATVAQPSGSFSGLNISSQHAAVIQDLSYIATRRTKQC